MINEVGKNYLQVWEMDEASAFPKQLENTNWFKKNNLWETITGIAI